MAIVYIVSELDDAALGRFRNQADRGGGRSNGRGRWKAIGIAAQKNGCAERCDVLLEHLLEVRVLTRQPVDGKPHLVVATLIEKTAQDFREAPPPSTQPLVGPRTALFMWDVAKGAILSALALRKLLQLPTWTAVTQKVKF
eukprot:CAMPEP_0115400468 /NCGR_PEP_ID=MMETSP0271-20121206/15373_1 /TAXON_ID=71861 /ORGANISM="Scrippsiella trochoidea, Strain CCMP3099" /LENGTH=140 /DNA_ID=CAMNT_0002824323 /DNA_START=32 /DNA_END=454 /DNA_ORIENTATION=-